MTDKIIKTTVATLQKRMTRYPSEDWLVVFLTDHGGTSMCDVTRSLVDNQKALFQKWVPENYDTGSVRLKP